MAETSLQSSEVATCKAGATGAGNLVVISGPSGVGKGTLVERLVAAVPGVSLSVSVTTRPQRPEEVEGRDYFFRSEKQFGQMVEDGELIEWAEFAGALYGTPKAWVEKELASRHDVVLEIDVQGARQIQKQCPQAVLIFLSPPDFPALEERLRKRATEPPEQIALRLSKARKEMKQKHLFHYEVVNDNIDEALNNLVHIIYAERCRIRPSPGSKSK